MFDFGFSELMVIGAVALVVLGPERLPTVARTAGEWLGKAQRLVQQVKSDIEREAELSELKKIQQEAKSVADDLNKTVKGQVDQINSEIKDLESSVNNVGDELSASFDKAAKEGFGEKPALDAADGASDIVGDTGTVDTTSSDAASPVDDFYGWYGNQNNYVDEDDNSKVFEKRYKSGPSIDDLAEQIERLKAELGDRSPQLGGNNRRYAMRARSNRVRIYR